MVRQRPRKDPVQFIKRFEDVSLDCCGDHEERELVETRISNMLFDYRLNLENLCITLFVDLLQRTRRTMDYENKKGKSTSGHDNISGREKEEA